MGWSSGAEIFDAVLKELLLKSEVDKEAVVRALWDSLRDMDWDTTDESIFLYNPIVRAAILKSEPHYFDYEDDEED